jgi:NitT/TauT family transport system substrate-binding protein
MKARFDTPVPAIAIMACCALLAVAPAWSNDRIVVSIHANTVGGTTAHYIARDKGYFAAEGLDVEFIKQETAGALTATLLAGQADIGTTALSAAYFNAARNKDLRVLAAATLERAGYKSQAYVASMPAYRAGLTRPADLAGKRIAISTLGGGIHLNVLLLGRKYGFPVLPANLVQLTTNANIAVAVKANAVAAAVVSSLPAAALDAAGEGKIIGYVGDETPYLTQVVFASSRAISTRRAVLVRYLRAYLRAARDYADTFEQRDASGVVTRGPEASGMLAILAKNTGQSAGLIADALPYVQPDGAFDPAEVSMQLAIWQQAGMVPARVESSGMTDLSLLRDARAPR